MKYCFYPHFGDKESEELRASRAQGTKSGRFRGFEPRPSNSRAIS